MSNHCLGSEKNADYEVYTDLEITGIPYWDTQLAELLNTAWTAHDGIPYPPYPDLTNSEYWKKVVSSKWSEDTMHSWVAVKDGDILSHAAIVSHEDERGKFYEIGRLAVTPEAPKGTTTNLFLAGTNYIEDKGMYGFLEGTVSHSRSQYMARVIAGWAFAGYVYRGFVAGKHLDGVLLDNSGTDFIPRTGIVAELRDKAIECSDIHKERLYAMAGRITVARAIDITPGGLVHTLPDLIEPLNTIITQNTINK